MLTGHQCGTSMDKVITTRLLRFDLNEHSARHADLSKCELTRILSSRNSSSGGDSHCDRPPPPELPLTAVCGRL